MPSLVDAVRRLESGGTQAGIAANAAANPRMVFPEFGQYGAFVQQYGGGAAGINNYGAQVLAANPNATFGDFYRGYSSGTGNPAAIPSQFAEPSAYRNMVNNSPIDPNTPLANIISGNGTIAASGVPESSMGFNMTSPDQADFMTQDFSQSTGLIQPSTSQADTSVLSGTPLQDQTNQLVPNVTSQNIPIFDQSQFNPIDAQAGGSRPTITQAAQSGALGTQAQQDTTSQVDANAIAGASSGTGSGSIEGSGTGTPIQIGPQQGFTELVKSAVKDVESAFGNEAQKMLTSAVESVTNYFGIVGNTFVRLGLVILGIVLIAVAINKLMGGPSVIEVATTAAKAA